MSRLASSLLPIAIGDVELGERLVVLDLGGPSPEGVRFLNQFDCTVYYVGVRERLEELKFSEDGEPPDFHQLVGIESGLRFDVCLLWDCLNFIDYPTLIQLSRYLDAFVANHTRIHAFLAFSKETPLAITKYRMLNRIEIEIGEIEGTACPFPHTIQDLESGFASGGVRRGVLLTNNRREVLIATRTRSY